jgi:hypothetical protein
LLAAWQITNCGELMSERADARVNVTIAGTAGHVSLPGRRSEAWLTPARTSSRRPAGAGAMVLVSRAEGPGDLPGRRRAEFAGNPADWLVPVGLLGRPPRAPAGRATDGWT